MTNLNSDSTSRITLNKCKFDRRVLIFGYIVMCLAYVGVWVYGVGFVLIMSGLIDHSVIPLAPFTMLGLVALITWHLMALVGAIDTPIHMLNRKLKLFGWKD